MILCISTFKKWLKESICYLTNDFIDKKAGINKSFSYKFNGVWDFSGLNKSPIDGYKCSNGGLGCYT